MGIYDERFNSRLAVSTLLFLLSFTGIFGQPIYDSVSTFAGSSSPGLFDGPLTFAQFNSPYGICVDPQTGTIYVADGANNCIRRILAGSVVTVAGNGTPGDVDGVGTNARFRTPSGVFFKNGVLYICDNLNNKIKRMDSSGMVATIAGNGLQGLVDGIATGAEFNEPKSLVVDDSGVVFVADYENHCIRKIQGGLVTTIAGTGVAGDGLGPGSSAQLDRPRDICIDEFGTLYFVDLGNHKVKMLTTSNEVQLLAGSGIPGALDGLGGSASFSTPVAIDWESPGELLVLDAVYPKFRRVDLLGNVTTVAGSGLIGYQDGSAMDAAFNLPQDICIDSLGRVFVTDFNNHVIRMMTSHDPEQGVDLPGAIYGAPLIVYPSPSSDEISIEFYAPDRTSMEIMIHDELGRMVFVDEFDTGKGSAKDRTLMLNVADWAPGRYVVLLTSAKLRYYGTFSR